MKLRLLFAGLVLSAITSNAQVATLNENFNSFSSGSATFPQNGWSAVMAPNPMPFPPTPLMIVTTGADKAVQIYSGNNSSAPSYLIAPQIVAPAGDKSLSFTTFLAAPYQTPATLQIGLASNPTDMSTFVAVGSPINFTSAENTQNVTVNIPASSSSYLVFRVTPTASHTAIQIDNVIYNTTGSLSVSDNLKSDNQIKFAVNTQNTALQFVGKVQPKTVEIYSAAGQQVASGKVNNSNFDISTLQSGVYYIQIETAEGKAVKSKFIKK